ILDADKEGFLRSETSLIQTIGRAARNVNAKVVLYADRVTNSMQRAMVETQRRRELQLAYNAKHGITPRSVESAIETALEEQIEAGKLTGGVAGQGLGEEEKQEMIEQLHAQMLVAAEEQKFEEAARLRDEIARLKGEAVASPQEDGPRKRGKGRRKRQQ